MPSSITRDEIARQSVTLPEAVQRELEELRMAGQLGDDYGSKTEQRCYVCCEVESKKLVNKLLAAGLTNREIAESCQFINKRRMKVGDKRLIDAKHIWYHNREHFNIDEPAKAVYRHIAERYAEQANIDHINGVGTAVHPYALLHTVMVKGFSQVAAESQPVSTHDAIDAATKLHAMTSADAGHKKMADLIYLTDRIIAAAQHFIPSEQYEDFLAMVEGRETITPMAQLTEKVHTVVREFKPHSLHDDEEVM